MRTNILKKHSTKAERVFAELLKELRIPFRFREIHNGREIDFVIGTYAIEIEAHAQDPERNFWLIEQGLAPIHFTNSQIIQNKELIRTWLEQIFSPR